MINKPGCEIKIGVYETLFGEDYKKSTWICIFIAIANMMSGINILNIYAISIFDDI